MREKDPLSILDKKILLELDKDARQSSSQIAKKVGTSKQLVTYHINRLEKKGIIQKYVTVIDADRLGYSYYNLYIEMQNLSGNKEKEFIAFLKSRPYITWIVRTIGNYGFVIAILANGTTLFNNYFREIMNEYGQYVADNDLFIIIDAFKMQYQYIGNLKDLPGTHHIGTKEVLDLKKEDMAILQMLDDDARVPIVDIANKLKLSAPVVSYKIKNLLKAGVIQGFRPQLNTFLLGKEWYLISFKLNSYSEEQEQRFLNFLKQKKQVVYLTRGVGAFNFVLDVHVKDALEMDKLLNEIRSEFSGMVKNYQSLRVVDNPKVGFFPREWIQTQMT